MKDAVLKERMLLNSTGLDGPNLFNLAVTRGVMVRGTKRAPHFFWETGQTAPHEVHVTFLRLVIFRTVETKQNI